MIIWQETHRQQVIKEAQRLLDTGFPKMEVTKLFHKANLVLAPELRRTTIKGPSGVPWFVEALASKLAPAALPQETPKRKYTKVITGKIGRIRLTFEEREAVLTQAVRIKRAGFTGKDLHLLREAAAQALAPHRCPDFRQEQRATWFFNALPGYLAKPVPKDEPTTQEAPNELPAAVLKPEPVVALVAKALTDRVEAITAPLAPAALPAPAPVAIPAPTMTLDGLIAAAKLFLEQSLQNAVLRALASSEGQAAIKAAIPAPVIQAQAPAQARNGHEAAYGHLTLGESTDTGTVQKFRPQFDREHSDRKTRVLVIGLIKDQQITVKAEFSKKFDLEIETADCNSHRLRTLASGADKTYVMTGSVPHRVIDAVKPSAKQFCPINGSLQELRRLLNALPSVYVPTPVEAALANAVQSAPAH